MSDEMTEQIIGAAIEVHRLLGPGLLESIYEEALCVELELRGIAFERQVEIDVYYKGRAIKGQRIDLLVERTVIVEIKSVEAVGPVHRKQLLTYLRLTELRLGLLINFNVELIKHGIHRVINEFLV